MYKTTSDKLLSEIDMSTDNIVVIGGATTTVIHKTASLCIPKGFRKKI